VALWLVWLVFSSLWMLSVNDQTPCGGESGHFLQHVRSNINNTGLEF
jgi:hypothetical protein